MAQSKKNMSKSSESEPTTHDDDFELEQDDDEEEGDDEEEAPEADLSEAEKAEIRQHMKAHDAADAQLAKVKKELEDKKSAAAKAIREILAKHSNHPDKTKRGQEAFYYNGVPHNALKRPRKNKKTGRTTISYFIKGPPKEQKKTKRFTI